MNSIVKGVLGLINCKYVCVIRKTMIYLLAIYIILLRNWLLNVFNLLGFRFSTLQSPNQVMCPLQVCPCSVWLLMCVFLHNPCLKSVSKQINRQSPVPEHSIICTVLLRQQRIWGSSQSPLGCYEVCFLYSLQTNVPSFD